MSESIILEKLIYFEFYKFWPIITNLIKYNLISNYNCNKTNQSQIPCSGLPSSFEDTHAWIHYNVEAAIDEPNSDDVNTIKTRITVDSPMRDNLKVDQEHFYNNLLQANK